MKPIVHKKVCREVSPPFVFDYSCLFLTKEINTFASGSVDFSPPILEHDF